MAETTGAKAFDIAASLSSGVSSPFGASGATTNNFGSHNDPLKPSLILLAGFLTYVVAKKQGWI